MFIPTRRNRNIGTSKQGHGQNNKMVIPDTWHDGLIFTERLNKYCVVKRLINHKEYIFIVEFTREDCVHACTIDDITRILTHIPKNDTEGLNLIVLRQPKRKEQLLDSVWGRLRFYCEIDNKYKGPGIIIESFDYNGIKRYSKSLKPEEKREFERIIDDGHQIIEDKKDFVINLSVDSVRSTQLYRTLLHEIGHYVQYLQLVEHSTNADDRWYDYERISNNEKEVFAHSYADRMKKKLEELKVLPFDRIIDLDSIKQDKLRLEDFIINKNSAEHGI